jgi:hypothetical protein
MGVSNLNALHKVEKEVKVFSVGLLKGAHTSLLKKKSFWVVPAQMARPEVRVERKERAILGTQFSN